MAYKRAHLEKRIDDLLTVCSEVYIVMTLYQILKVCDYMTENSSKLSDGSNKSNNLYESNESNELNESIESDKP